MADERAELIQLTQRLLRSIAAADWATYEQLCDPAITCFEPEARGHLVEGMDFHRYYFDLGAADGPRNTTLASPHVRLMGEVALVAYTRLVQHADATGRVVTSSYEETRLWQKQDGRWKHVHFHRSLPTVA